MTEQMTSKAIQSLKYVAKGQADPEQLLRSLEAALSHFVDGARVRILTAELNGFHRGNLFIPSALLVGTGLLEEGWTMPQNTDTDIRPLLSRERIDVLISPTVGEEEAGTLIAFDERNNEGHYTLPETIMLRHMASVVNNLYTHCRFNLQTMQSQELDIIRLVVARVAHEIRNPVSAISTFAQLIPQWIKNERFLQEWSAVIPGEASRIEALSEQLLNLAKPRKYSFEAVDLHEVISHIIVVSRDKADKANVILTFVPSATPSWVKADAQAIRQVLTNLTTNAIQSISRTNQQGAVIIRTSEEGDAIVIEVEDDGPGIPELIRQQLFRPFGSNGKTDGHGLGLAICAEIARAHKGTIRGENHPGGGAKFRLTIPALTAS